jgi:MinD-like ATPase involved in chromosome partitioning or flagellar assembly
VELPTYTSIWRIEKRLYKLYDFRLPMPLPVGQIAVFTAITVPYVILLTLFGLPFNHNLFWLYVLPPGVLTWLATRPVLESKRLPELIISQVRYIGEPSAWCRMTPHVEKDEIVVVGQVWRRSQPQPAAAPAVGTAAVPAVQTAVPAAGLAAETATVPALELAAGSAAATAAGSAAARPGVWPARRPAPAPVSGRAAGRVRVPAAGEPARSAAAAMPGAGPQGVRAAAAAPGPSGSVSRGPAPASFGAAATAVPAAPARPSAPASAPVPASAAASAPAPVSAPVPPSAPVPGSAAASAAAPVSAPVPPSAPVPASVPVPSSAPVPLSAPVPPSAPAAAHASVAPAPPVREAPPGSRDVPGAGTGRATGTPPVVVVPAQQGPADPPTVRPRTVERALSGPAGQRSTHWRDHVALVPGGAGPGRPDHDKRDRARAVLPISGSRLVAVVGCTVGAGQTVTTLMVADLLASLRGQAVAALDLNPGPASLGELAAPRPALTVKSLLAQEVPAGRQARNGDQPRARGQLDVFAPEVRGDGAVDMGDLEYHRMFGAVAAGYQLTLVDPGAAAVARVLSAADQLVLVAPASPDAARAFAMTQEWLGTHGYGALSANSIAVVNGLSKRSMPHAEQAELVVRGKCRAIVRVPWDDHLAEPQTERGIRDSLDPGAAASRLGQLRPPVLQAYTALAGVLVAALSASLPRRRRAAT